MSQFGWATHAVILLSMLIVLWAGGDYVEQWWGHGVRTLAELLLILWYLIAVAGMRPFSPREGRPWRRRKDDGPR